MSQEPPRPSQAIIDAWIDGRLSEAEARRVEKYFEIHPEEFPSSEIDLQPLAQQKKIHDDPDLTEVITRVTALGSDHDAYDFSQDSWLDLITPSSEPGCLGHIEKYAILSVLSITGMSIVFQALDRQLDRKVAIKALSPALAHDPQARERFLREARLMASLEHDHILPIYEIQESHQPWFAMRLIEGGSLQEALDRQFALLQDPSWLLSITRQIASALESAHTAGVTHRDLKPANILISSDASQVWLTDFGIARNDEDPSLTQQNVIPGTPRYMSPEQVTGKQIDHRSDYFSLGSVLYHLATGHPPFTGKSSTAILHQISVKDPKLIKIQNPKIPRWFSYFIENLMSKDPEKRPQNLIQQLEQKKAPPTGRSFKKWLFTFSFLVLLGITLLLLKNRFSPHQNDLHYFSNEPRIRNESGVQFSSLRQAILDSPPTSKLTLSGHFILTEPINVPPGEITLQSAPNTRASIEIDHEEKFGITTKGSLHVRGIDFIRKSSLRVCHTLSARGAESIIIEDCHFRSPITRAGVFVYGVSAFSSAQIEIKNTAFHGKRFYSVLISEAPGTAVPETISLKISDAYLQGFTGVFLRLGLNRPRLDLNCERVIMDGKRFLRFGPLMTLGPTELQMTHCLLASKNEHILFENSSQNTLTEYLSWKSRENVYSPVASLLRVTQPRYTLSKIHDLLKALPESQDLGSSHQPVFDLFGELHPDIQEPARITFQNLHPK